MNEVFTKLPDTVMLDEDAPALVIIDQTLLPGELRLLRLYRQEIRALPLLHRVPRQIRAPL